MRYLSKLMLSAINRKTIESHGGNFIDPNNFLNEANLDYLIEIVQSEMFGEPLYPTLSEKAGLYM